MKKSKLTAAEEARNEAMRISLDIILRHGDAKIRHALKKMLADALTATVLARRAKFGSQILKSRRTYETV